LPNCRGTPLRSCRPLLSICVLLLAGACGTARTAAPLPVETAWSADDYKYRIGAGDELGIRFPLNPDLNFQLTVGPDGRGAFPLISATKVAGLTVEEANATLSKAFGAYLSVPIVER
jgi:protein involved in polysaccharide export with SLBB domain